jgi:hypothetical protein
MAVRVGSARGKLRIQLPDWPFGTTRLVCRHAVELPPLLQTDESAHICNRSNQAFRAWTWRGPTGGVRHRPRQTRPGAPRGAEATACRSALPAEARCEREAKRIL